MEELKNLNIGVLMGGASSERDISLKSGNEVFTTLLNSGFKKVKAIDILSEDKISVTSVIANSKIDIAFIAMHGRFGEDGQIQTILESLNIPFTGSGPQASRLAMNKAESKDIFKKAGLRIAKSEVIKKENFLKNPKKRKSKFPVVVKPSSNGSSIGLSIVENNKGLIEAIDLAFQYDDKIIIEEYIEGREMTVGILGEEALPVIEIVPKKRFFDYEAKYTSGLTDYLVPAPLDNDTSLKLRDTALKAHNSLGCMGVSRVDFILDKNNDPVLLELNCIPGFTKMSLLPKAALVRGIDFQELCTRLLNLAIKRQGLK